MLEKNFGLLLGERKETDFIAGKFSPVKDEEILRLDGQWDDYLPLPEYQNKGFETRACVTFSALNCIETLYRRLTGEEKNFSDRFTAKMSGTTKKGNYLWQVANAIRHYGLLPEEDWPYVKGWDNYYKPIPKVLQKKALKFLDKWIVYYEWVEDEEQEIVKQLEYAPLQVTVRYDAGNKILNPKGKYNHAVMLYGYKLGKYWKIYDHYSQTKKKYIWNYKFQNILKYTLVKKLKPMKLKDNTLVQLVEGNGGFGLYIDGKLLVDDTAKILASFIVRNNGKIESKIKTVTQEQWDSIPHYNLKWQRI